MITQESIRRAMTRQQAALDRVKSAYKMNNIPVPARDEKRLARLSSGRLENLADYWESRFAESRKEAAVEESEGDEEEEESTTRTGRKGAYLFIPRHIDGEPNLLHPSCPIAVIQKVLRRMSGLHGPRPTDPGTKTDYRYHGLNANGVHRIE